MDILLWRTWTPLYAYSATFSSLETHGIGGTCSQLLWHARGLVALGHSVQVLGTSREDVKEEGVEFLGATDQASQERLILSGRVIPPRVIFLEGAFSGAPFLKKHFPEASVVHVGQNIDRYGAEKAWKMAPWIDLYALVSPGQLAQCNVAKPGWRHKFVLLRNVVPWEQLYKDLKPEPIEEKVVWIGAWTKKGLRAWSETMAQIMADFPNLRWELYGPSHGAHVGGMPSHLFMGLDLPMNRVMVLNAPLPQLAKAIATARVVLVSLGNETACISALDGHAAGRPVLSGNDMVFKYNNPDGTGIRVFRSAERYKALTYLLNNPSVCNAMGAAGRAFVAAERTERNQAQDLSAILSYTEILRMESSPMGFTAPNPLEDGLSYLRERVQRKVPLLSRIVRMP
jgi:glycosyltransferase involved in cell wall biosynthesis